MISNIPQDIFEEAVLIRLVEEKFLELFSSGELNGTVHTCVGQEFSAVAFAGQLKVGDSLFSNHRCHGHYISFTKDYYGLLAELMGKATGVCGGIGSSQHLCKDGFYSNGPQGSLVPVAAGVALANKLLKKESIALCFIGDGTLGEGIVYETMNIASKWNLPLVIVCENNFYSQSTPQKLNLSGEITNRASAFGIKTYKSNTWDVDELMQSSKKSIDYARDNCKPVFHLVETYRLNPHSKGDDDRDISEIEEYSNRDVLNVIKLEDSDTYGRTVNKYSKLINSAVEKIRKDPEMSIQDYAPKPSSQGQKEWVKLDSNGQRQVKLLNKFFRDIMENDSRVIFMGEDVISPYGGAFKVAENLSFQNPDKVFTTPISEAAIVGVSNGLAISGFKPYVEIMFGDFVPLAMDQVINNSSKFYHMYNKQISCPLVLRTPMGGKRGYGPTHSQTLDKFLIGIDNVTTVALNSLLNPSELYTSINGDKNPVIVIENKLDYGKLVEANIPSFYSAFKTQELYPVVRLSPVEIEPELTIVTYGGMVQDCIDSIEIIFSEHEILPEILIISKIHPLDVSEIKFSVSKTGNLITVEEGSSAGGIGGEIIASLTETMGSSFKARRVSALPVPIPSVKSLEDLTLPSVNTIVKILGDMLK
tara:strand:+ start:114 stop:2051 length:1938 start_codon:yes stop_codon:yes gene_type:complete